MTDLPPRKLNYATERPRGRLVSIPGVVTAVAAGALTLGSAFLVGPCLMWVVCILAGVAVGYVCSRFASGNAVVAGFVGNIIASVSMLGCAIIINVYDGMGMPFAFDWREVILVTSVFTGAFTVPGLFGSLWVYAGRGTEKR